MPDNDWSDFLDEGGDDSNGVIDDLGGADDDSNGDDLLEFGDLDDVAASNDQAERDQDADLANDPGYGTDNDLFGNMDTTPAPVQSPAPQPAPASAPEPMAAPQDYTSSPEDSFTSLDDIEDKPAAAPVVPPTPVASSIPQQEQSAPHPVQQYQQPAPQQVPVMQTTAYMNPVTSFAGGIDVELIRKIIAIIDDYRHLEAKDQSVLKDFLSSVSALGKSPKIDGTEASVVKGVIEIDDDMREGVIDLMDSKNKTGANRAFYLMSLDAKRFSNMQIIMQMMQLLNQNEIINVTDTLPSIREAAEKMDGYLNERFQGQAVKFLKPVYQVFVDSQKIMES